jgi:cell division GTPase FtsZ
MENEIFSNSEKKTTDSIIKVIGVGGGGSNAVNYMYLQNIGEDQILKQVQTVLEMAMAET